MHNNSLCRRDGFGFGDQAVVFRVRGMAGGAYSLQSAYFALSFSWHASSIENDPMTPWTMVFSLRRLDCVQPSADPPCRTGVLCAAGARDLRWRVHRPR